MVKYGTARLMTSRQRRTVAYRAWRYGRRSHLLCAVGIDAGSSKYDSGVIFYGVLVVEHDKILGGDRIGDIPSPGGFVL